jgi:hypothetical protein
LATESAPASASLTARATAFARSNAAAPVALAVMMLVSVLARVWLARAVKTPWILVDEFLYSEQAKSFAAHGNYWIRGAPSSIVSYLYPALISPAWWADSMRTTYGLAKAINSVLMTLVAIPVYLWGIRIAPRRYVFAAVALTLLLPAFFYTGELMTENAFFPAFVTSCFAIALALERPTLFRQGLMLVAMLATVAVRFQGIVLLAVLPTALLVKLILDLLGREEGSRRRVVRNALVPFWPTAVAAVVLAGAYAAYKHQQGLGLRSGLGNYQGVVTGNYPIHAAARWTLYHFAELPLAFGYIPACAFLVLLGLGLTRAKSFSAAERSFLAVTAAATILLVPEVGAFASKYSLRIEERNMFALAPLFLLALCLWLARGAPRPLFITAVALALPAALLVTIPLVSLLNPSIYSDTFGLIPLLRLSEKLSGGAPFVKKLLIAGGVVGGLLFAFTPRRYAAPVLVAVVGVFLVMTSYSVHGAIRDYARNLAGNTGVLADPTWIDNRANGRDVAVLYGNASDTFTEAVSLWEAEFWNRRLDRVYTFGTAEPVGLPESAVSVNPVNGRLTTTDPAVQRELNATREFVSDPATQLASTTSDVNGPLAFYAAVPPPRIASSSSGIAGDGWMSSDATYTSFAGASRGKVAVVLSRAAWRGPDVPGHVKVTIARRRGSSPGKPIATRTFTIHSGKTRKLLLPAPAGPYTVSVHIAPTFSPSQFGQSDTRQLGATVYFAPVP